VNDFGMVVAMATITDLTTKMTVNCPVYAVLPLLQKKVSTVELIHPYTDQYSKTCMSLPIFAMVSKHVIFAGKKSHKHEGLYLND
jgi:hypothetical protein